MAIETWWDCIFVLTNGRYVKGAITQQDGLELKSELNKLVKTGLKTFTVIATNRDLALTCTDILFTEIYLEVEE